MPTKLGQNFLNDKSVIEKIISSSRPEEAGFVIEVGPGEGVLTQELAKHCRKVIAIELDDKLIPALHKKFENTKNIEIIHQDILKLNLPELIDNVEMRLIASLPRNNYKLIANIPYYITSPIIRLFLEQEQQPKEIILMIQKEVAERIVAKPGEMSILAVSVQYYAQAEILFPVSKNSFSPVPKVDSAVIGITPNKKFEKGADKKFFRLVKAGFSAKRKTLINNLANSLQLEKKLVEEKIKTAGLPPTVRAQELSIKNWKKLSALLEE